MSVQQTVHLRWYVPPARLQAPLTLRSAGRQEGPEPGQAPGWEGQTLAGPYLPLLEILPGQWALGPVSDGPWQEQHPPAAQEAGGAGERRLPAPLASLPYLHAPWLSAGAQHSQRAPAAGQLLPRPASPAPDPSSRPCTAGRGEAAPFPHVIYLQQQQPPPQQAQQQYSSQDGPPPSMDHVLLLPRDGSPPRDPAARAAQRSASRERPLAVPPQQMDPGSLAVAREQYAAEVYRIQAKRAREIMEAGGLA